jgi:Cytochrome c554 and c-prime
MQKSGLRRHALFQALLTASFLVNVAGAQAGSQKKPPAMPPGKYVGPGTCGATACHGSVQPRTLTLVLQNEYSTWVTKDAHFKALHSLDNPVSQRMGRILGIGNPATSPKCLACHSLAVPPEEKAREFDLEGVSCESCHGPASAWLESHMLKGWTPHKSYALGMVDLSDPAGRSEKCLSCHLGTTEKEVDHKMIAAGHPDLVFELDSYSAIQPPHWKPAADPNQDFRLWAVNQAVQLRESLKKLARHTQGSSWPEFSEYACFSCHHSLTKPESSWRQARGYQNRAPGSPPWESAHYTVFRILAKDVDAPASQQLDAQLATVNRLASNLNSSPREIADNALAAGDLANRFVAEMNQATFDRARAARLLQAIADQGDTIANQDTRSAEQAAMALDTIFLCYEKQTSNHPAVRAAIDGLFQEVTNPSSYDAPRFSAQMRKVSAALREAGIASQ